MHPGTLGDEHLEKLSRGLRLVGERPEPSKIGSDGGRRIARQNLIRPWREETSSRAECIVAPGGEYAVSKKD